ncbi:MAG: preprotein translocase subunit Sec61beta [Patescibacteria group bacterium]|jgi:preprotein translocase subunit Sec61beta
MAEIGLPGAGGLMRYNEEYDSKLKFGPEMVIVMVIATIAFVVALRYIYG